MAVAVCPPIQSVRALGALPGDLFTGRFCPAAFLARRFFHIVKRHCRVIFLRPDRGLLRVGGTVWAGAFPLGGLIFFIGRAAAFLEAFRLRFLAAAFLAFLFIVVTAGIFLYVLLRGLANAVILIVSIHSIQNLLGSRDNEVFVKAHALLQDFIRNFLVTVKELE